MGSACLVNGHRQVPVPGDALDLGQVLIALHKGLVVCLLVQLSRQQSPLLLTRLCLSHTERHSDHGHDAARACP